MKRIILSFALLCALVSVAFPQDCKSCLRKSDVLQKRDKATVYISLERIGNEEVLLRIHNNTPWIITFVTDSPDEAKDEVTFCDGRKSLAPPDGVEVDARFLVEVSPPPSMSRVVEVLDKKTGKWKRVPKTEEEAIRTPNMGYPDVGGYNTPLQPGRSVVFGVARRWLLSPYRVYIHYQYEWEGEGKGGYPLEPEHRVYFDDIYGLDRKQRK
jgi:hypothetical protein